jgi:hypothetical protein
MARDIESIAPLPGNTGYAVTLDNPLDLGLVNSFGVIQGYHYRGKTPKLRFTIRFNAQEDPYTLKFVCDCTDDQLVQSELLPLLKELQLAPPDLSELPLAAGPYQPSRRHPHYRA